MTRDCVTLLPVRSTQFRQHVWTGAGADSLLELHVLLLLGAIREEAGMQEILFVGDGATVDTAV